MKIAGIDFPEKLLKALEDDKLVVFAGAGVSMGEPANLPNFKELAKKIAHGTNEEPRRHESSDSFLGRLQRDREINVHNLAKKIITESGALPTDLHKDLLRLYPEVEKIRIVTTNFDLLFEEAANYGGKERTEGLEVFRAPALPLGMKFNGIIHIHGAVSHPNDMVLTEKDFALGYLSNRWATNFLIEMFRHYTVLFIGYSHKDIMMNYLSQALPKDVAKKHFTLQCVSSTNSHSETKQDEASLWEKLGSNVIWYKKSEEFPYEGLHKGIKRLNSLYCDNSSLQNFGVTKIALKTPPINEEEREVIEFALKKEVGTQFFISAARVPEWIDWLDKREYLKKLFDAGPLSKQDEKLAIWLARYFTIQHTNKLFWLIAQHKMHMHPFFWHELAREIALSKPGQLDKNSLSRWVSVLFNSMPKDFNSPLLISQIGQHCIRHEILDSLLQIFSAMVGRHIQGITFSLFPGEKESPSPNLQVDFLLEDPYNVLKNLWGYLNLHVAEIAESMLRMVLERLEEFHRKLLNSQEIGLNYDNLNSNRSAIEEHQQNHSQGAIDVLIDAARDCLSHLAEYQAEAAACWCDQLIRSNAPLLRRLAVHTIPQCAELTPDDKIEWLLEKNGLHEIETHHEIFQAVKSIYPNISPAKRKKVIKTVQNFDWPNEKIPNQDLHAAKRRLDWLDWLNKAAPRCTLTKQALEDLQKKHPEFTPNEHPDFTSWRSSGWSEPQAPWTVNDLLAKSAADLLPKLQSPQPTEPRSDLRFHLGNFIVAEAAGQDFDWGLDLAKALAEKEKWDTEIWPLLIQKWSMMELDEKSSENVLECLAHAEPYLQCELEIARVLYSLLKNEEKAALLPKADKLAVNLWRTLENKEPALEALPEGSERDDWLSKAVNHPAGILALFWVKSLSILRRQQDPVPYDYYRKRFDSIVQNRGLPGMLARSILSSQLAFLLEVYKVWTKEHLLPQFSLGKANKNESLADFQAAWDGFLTWGELNSEVAELLKGAFLDAIEHIDSPHHLAGQKRQFINYYTRMIFYYTGFDRKDEEPKIKKGIPEIVHPKSKNKILFANSIGTLLQGINKKRQEELWQCWLKRYWEDRLNDVPAKLEGEEIDFMLEWVPYLTAVFSDAVNLAIKMPPAPLKRYMVIHELKSDRLLQDHPKAVAKMLLYLGELEAPGYMWSGMREFIEKLIRAGLPLELKKRLNELIVRLGLSYD